MRSFKRRTRYSLRVANLLISAHTFQWTSMWSFDAPCHDPFRETDTLFSERTEAEVIPLGFTVDRQNVHWRRWKIHVKVMSSVILIGRICVNLLWEFSHFSQNFRQIPLLRVTRKRLFDVRSSMPVKFTFSFLLEAFSLSEVHSTWAIYCLHGVIEESWAHNS